MDEPRLRVRVLCRELPGERFPHAYLGIQRGQDVVEQVSAARRQGTFVAEFRVGKKKDGSPNFLGPYAQGPLSDRFFCLSWGTKEPKGEFAMFRRLKIRLVHLTWREIRRSIASGEPMSVSLRLTDAKGAPLCATPPETHIRWEHA
jgi:hypothetical protein